MQNKDTYDWFGRMEVVMCVPWFLLLELPVVPVYDSPQAFGRERNQNSPHDYNRPELKCAMWFVA